MNDAPLTSNNRILVIDDNPAIHADFRKILQRPAGPAAALDAAALALFGENKPETPFRAFSIDSAPSGEAGLDLVCQAQARNHPYALAFVDVRMAPGWNGIETTARICKIDACIQIVICTAYADYSWEKIIEQLGQSNRLLILKKPFDSVEVLQMAHALTEKWELGQIAHARLEQLERTAAERTRDLEVANAQLRVESAERARTEKALHQAQKMQAIGQLAGGIAHDFNNLLGIIRGYAQCLALNDPQDAEVMEAVREIDRAAARAATLTSQMLLFSRKKPMQLRSLELNELIARFGSMLRRSVGENITLEIQAGKVPLTVEADPVMVEMVVLNLALNARDAMPQGGRLLIGTEAIAMRAADLVENSKARLGQFACIRVEDTGTGIAPEVLPHLFEPFYTTKEVGKGTGLGLASVYGIVEQHSGWIEVTSEPSRGATFKVFLPLCHPSKKLSP